MDYLIIFESIMRYVALLLFGIHLAFGAHTLQYFYTVVSVVNNIPEFTVVGTVDDQQFMYFDSNTMKVVPKTEWMRENEGAEYWKNQTQTVIGHYQEYKNIIHNIMDLCNQSISEGVHTLQVTYGCELEDDGTNRGYYELFYDGEHFISFDKNTFNYTADDPQADIIMNQWEADRAKVEYWKAFLENECIERMKMFLSYDRNTLERKVAPEVSLLQKNSSSPVICHATGFYPKRIIMTWKKNPKGLHEDVEVYETLPNTDGSFQKSISLSVKPEEWKKNPDVYTCVIQHVGAEKEIVVPLNKNNIRSNSEKNTVTVLEKKPVSETTTHGLPEEGLRRKNIDDFTKTTCLNVIGIVGEELILTCEGLRNSYGCCIRMYKFLKITENTTICRKHFTSNHCQRWTSFSCPYTADSTMTTKLQFFLQMTCGTVLTEFSVDVTGYDKSGNIALKGGGDSENTAITGLMSDDIIAIAVGCVLAITLFTVIMWLITWIKSSQYKRLIPGYDIGSASSASLLSIERQINF